MPGEVSTIQSLKAVNAWIDVINANINGGVRTAFKASRLKFAGSNSNVDRPGNATSLPLQFPEPSLTTANTVIDFTQGSITASTENTHLAIQGPNDFFLVASPDMINANPASATFGTTQASTTAKMFLTRDGEFTTDSNGFLRTSYGYYLVTMDQFNVSNGRVGYGASMVGLSSGIRAIYNNLDTTTTPTGRYITLSEFLSNPAIPRDVTGASAGGTSVAATIKLLGGKQSLRYSNFGSTVFDFGFTYVANVATTDNTDPNIRIPQGRSTDIQILNKSLEASNASMTQSVPELSLAQKLFSALTKVLQTKQTNIDGVINLIR